jgi:signal-transduction protein with cAMP-binding, CBS, and nucleotidyltransferase domain
MEHEPTLADVKTNRVVRLEKDKLVFDAAQLMKREDVSSVVVLDRNTICGIVTEGDIVRKVVCGELNPHETSLDTIMSSPVHTIDAGKTIVDAARLMRDMKVKKLVIVEGREVSGIISEHDIVDVLPALFTPKKI